jgi:hypothetical protein
LKIVEHARQSPNYDAQQAVRDFFNERQTFSVYVYVYFTPKISDPDVPGPLQGIMEKRCSLILTGRRLIPCL